MKNKLLIILAVIFFTQLFTTYAQAKNWKDNWTLNGIPLKKFDEAKPKDYLAIGGGMLTSMVTHWLGHVFWLEKNNKNWYQDGDKEVCTTKLNDSEMHDFGISGFFGQLAVGTIIKFTKYNRSFFATGYQLQTFSEITTYRFFRGKEKTRQGDLYLMDQNGDANMEQNLLSVWAGSLLFLDSPVK